MLTYFRNTHVIEHSCKSKRTIVDPGYGSAISVDKQGFVARKVSGLSKIRVVKIRVVETLSSCLHIRDDGPDTSSN